jgi:hypothetical protein
MSTRTCAAVVVLVVAVTAGGSAIAQQADEAAKQGAPQAEKRARASFKAAVGKFDAGDYEAAVALFREAYGLNPSWKLLYNIGQCEAALKRHGEALDVFEQYLSQGGDEVPVERREEVLAEVKRLRELSGSIEVAAPEGALVVVDGVERGRAPLSGRIRLAAGVDHAVRIELDGKALLERDVRVGGEENLVLDANPSAPAPVAAATQVADDGKAERDRKIRAGGWVGVGVGAAALVGGAITGGLALKTDKTIQSGCPGGVCPQSQYDNLDRRDTLAITTNVLLVAGAAIAATGAVLLIVFRDKERADDPAVAIVPIIGADGGGAAAAWRF